MTRLQEAFVSKCEGLTLSEYMRARTIVCSSSHRKACDCDGMLRVGKDIESKGVLKLSKAFRLCCTSVKYSSFQARRKLLQMPLAVVGAGTSKEGNCLLYLLEKQELVKLYLTQSLLAETRMQKQEKPEMSKEELQKLLNLAESESERERLKYAVVKSSGLSNRKARSLFGIDDMTHKKQKAHQAMEEASAIREAIESIAKVKEKVVLQSFGVDCDESESDESEASESETDTDDEMFTVGETEGQSFPSQACDKSKDCFPAELQLKDVNEGETYKHTTDTGSVFMNSHQLCDVLRKCDLNWFSFVQVLKELVNGTSEVLNQLLLDFSGQLSFVGLSEDEEKVVEQSRQAFLCCERLRENTESDNCVVEIMSDSDSSEAEIWAMGVSSPLDDRGRLLIKTRRAAIKRNSVRQIKKQLAEKRLMKRRSKRVGTILSECPGIGAEIEDFVKQCGAGADAWRRTGTLTFDGSRKVQKKATFRRIQQHLEDKYHRSIFYGTVVQLCCALNKRRRSVARYHGLANVVSKRVDFLSHSHGFLVWCGRTRHKRLLTLAARQIYRRKIPPVMLSNQRQPYQTTRQSNRSRAQDPVWVKVKFVSLFVYVEAFTKT